MRRAALVLVVSGLVLSGCWGGAGDDRVTGSAAAPTPQDELQVTAKEFEFSSRAWAVPAGSFSVEFTNRGTIEHEWAVLRRGITLRDQRSLREEMVLFEVEAVPEGTTHVQRFTLREPGHYQVVCALEGHFDAGMTSDLSVVRT